MVLFFTHIPFVVNHIINATPPERLQQHPLLFTTNHTDRTFFGWRLNLAQPPHPGHSTILLWSEIPSGMCAKLRTVAASNNRDHARNLLLLLARAIYIMVLFFTHIPFVVNHIINAMPPERLQQHPLLFTTNHIDHTFFVWRLNLAQPPHPGHSTILLWSEIPNGMCAKLRTVAASNNRDHACNVSYYCLLALHI